MIEIGNHSVGKGKRTMVIAEAGTNFGGNIDLAKAFIDAAADRGADVIKFQTHVRDAEMAENGMRQLGYGDLYDRLIKQELSVAEHEELQEYCRTKEISFLSTPFSVEGVELLDRLNVPAIKIGSGELTNYHLLRTAAETGRPLLISTGMADMDTVRDAVAFVDQYTNKYALLYCVSAYPTEPKQFELDLIEEMKTEFNVPVGFSDHSTGVDVAKLAIGRGADFIEKHFTLTRQLPWGDQEVSIEPDELEALTSFTDLAYAASGSEKKLSDEERDIKHWAHHSVVATERIEPGTEFTSKNVTTKRPGTGIPAHKYYDILGTTATAVIEPDDILQPADTRGY